MRRRADEPRPEVLKAAAEAAERQSLAALVRMRRQRVRWCLAFCFSVVALFALIQFVGDAPKDVAERPGLVGFAGLILVVLLLVSPLVVLGLTVDIRSLRRPPLKHPATAAGAPAAAEAAEQQSLAALVRMRRQRVRWCLAFCFSVVALFALIQFVGDAPKDVAERPGLVSFAVLIFVVLLLVSPLFVLGLTVAIRRRRRPARSRDAPRLIHLKRIRLFCYVLLCFSVVAVFVNPALGGWLFLSLWSVLGVTVSIWREQRPLKLPVLNDVTRPSPDGHRIKRKRLMWRSIFAATIVGFIAVSAGLDPSHDSPTIPVMFLLFSIAVLTTLGVSAMQSVKHSRTVQRDERKRRSKILEWQDVADAEFVLYLRSFTDDVAASRRMAGGLTPEEHFARILNQVGPVVAVGLPGENQPELGAYRLYLDNSVWQESVETLMGRAKLVVIRTGLTEGLGWEIERAVGLVLPQRLLIVVDDEQEMRRCLSWVRKIHPQVSASVRLGYRRVCGIRGLLVFDGNWRVTALRIRGMGWYKHRSGNVVDPGLARSMYPVFQTLDVEWPTPRIAVVRPLVLALALLGVILRLLPITP